MKKIVLLFGLLLLIGCKTPKTITEKEEIYVDRVEWRDTCIYIPVPIERVVNVVPMLDTLFMETSVSRAKAWVDTTSLTLKGELENKDTKIEYKTKIEKRQVTLKQTIQKTVVIEKRHIPNWVKYSMILMIILIVISNKKFLLKIISKIL